MLVLLDNNADGEKSAKLFADPVQVIVAQMPQDVAPALDRIEAAVAAGHHAAGFFSYELGYALEPKLSARLPQMRALPLLCFGIYGAARQLAEPSVLAWLGGESDPASLGPLEPDWSPETYRQRFAKAHQSIASGDVYQINLTFRMRFRLEGSPRALYRDLRARQPVAHGAFVDTGTHAILSLSPEQFFACDGRRIVSRPMKGTMARGRTAEADADARAHLASDPKQRAENLMIVDLMRNDIGRMAEIGSVTVTDLFTVETFKTVHQMTSGIEARLKDGIGIGDVVTALFPPGSITGAPKIKAMELISQLETSPRGIYCGAIGYFGPGQSARFNVAIRTAVVGRDGAAEMGIGSGIVADSTAGSEYEECLLKARFLGPVSRRFELIETLLYEDGAGFWLLDQHLARLKASAVHFGFAYRDADIRQALEAARASQPAPRLRVRLLLSRDGSVSAKASALAQASQPANMRYVLAESPVDSRDPMLRHKTTDRLRYDDDWKLATEAGTADEVVYLNERGELTEGSRTSLFLQLPGDDVLATPALRCGLLPGVLRGRLIGEGRAKEAILTPAGLARAEAVLLGNSVRGLVRAVPANQR